MGELLPVPVTPPGLDVTVKPVIAEPPLFAGALNATETVVPPVTVATTLVGAPGGEAPAPPIIIALIDIRLILRH
jgi:hypothetical protein